MWASARSLPVSRVPTDSRDDQLLKRLMFADDGASLSLELARVSIRLASGHNLNCSHPFHTPLYWSRRTLAAAGWKSPASIMDLFVGYPHALDRKRPKPKADESRYLDEGLRVHPHRRPAVLLPVPCGKNCPLLDALGEKREHSSRPTHAHAAMLDFRRCPGPRSH